MVKEYLDLALQRFNASMIGTRVIYRFARETPELFCNAGLALMIQAEDTPAVRYVASLLLRQQNVLKVVSDPFRFTKVDAQALFQYLMTFEPSLDIRLAQYVRGLGRALQGELDDRAVERALDILDWVSHGRRIVEILSYLIEHTNPRISSKATLVIGRRIQNVDWAEKQLLTQKDPQRRANAIESIWGIDTEKARRLMAQNVDDPHCQVAGNSTYGLHMVGDARSHFFAKRMALDNDPAFRSTAAWVMGQIGDPGFLGPLGDLLKDDCPSVKSASLRSMVNIRREQARHEAFLPKVVPVAEPVVEEIRKSRIPIPDMQLSFNGKHIASRVVLGNDGLRGA